MVTSATARTAARTPTRASVPEAASEPTLAISIDATRGSTVMRIRLMKIVPTGARTATIVAPPGTNPPATARPARKPATRPTSTRVVNDTRRRLTESDDDERASAASPCRPRSAGSLPAADRPDPAVLLLGQILRAHARGAPAHRAQPARRDAGLPEALGVPGRRRRSDRDPEAVPHGGLELARPRRARAPR